MSRSIFRRVRLSAGVRMAATVAALALSTFSVARVLSAPMSAVVTVPDRVGFEGFLVDDATGNPLGGIHTLVFTVYDAATGGVARWTEEHQGVEVADGLYAVILGEGTPFAADTFDGDRWIGLAVDGGAEMASRTRVSSVPFALTAGTVDGRHASDLEVPAGVIVMWSGAIVDVPAGWALCDGEDGRPDLRDRFVVGAGSTYVAGDTGGEAAHTLTEGELPSHAHSVNPPNTSTTSNGAHSHSVRGTYPGSTAGIWTDNSRSTAWNGGYTSSAGSHTHTVDIPAFGSAAAGGGQAHENRPPYYAVAYIIKLEN